MSEEMTDCLPLVALRDTVVFPKFVVPLFIGRPKSIKAIARAFENNGVVVFVTQKDSTLDLVTPDDLYRFGTVCHIEQMIKLTDGTIKILADGLFRAKKPVRYQELYRIRQRKPRRNGGLR